MRRRRRGGDGEGNYNENYNWERESDNELKMIIISRVDGSPNLKVKLDISSLVCSEVKIQKRPLL
jgi:hypothetical protein